MSEVYETKIEKTSNGYLVEFGFASKKYFETLDAVIIYLRDNIERLI